MMKLEGLEAVEAGSPEYTGAPVGMLAELTHRCPLQCLYCSNPLEMDRVDTELTTDEWRDVMRQAGELGVLQVHLSGGEPTVRQDFEEILEAAVQADIYTNLITSGVTLTHERLERMVKIGLDHVQLSIHDTDPANAERISAYKGGAEKKREVARWVKELGLALTINIVVHRQNIENVPAMIDYAVEAGAGRIEVAHTQYYGWALRNFAALIPTREKFYESIRITDAAKERLKGILFFDVVAHDHYAVRPKPCYGGWARRFFNITPSGKILPCHACETIPGLEIDNVRSRPLADTWFNGQAFQRFRGTAWMKEPCRSCERREIDWGGCRCQALTMTGDAADADPACVLSPWHKEFAALAERESHKPPPAFIYRHMRAPRSATTQGQYSGAAVTTKP
jgi:pyrroloquinoline quinone biosynthesis protein E